MTSVIVNLHEDKELLKDEIGPSGKSVTAFECLGRNLEGVMGEVNCARQGTAFNGFSELCLYVQRFFLIHILGPELNTFS